MDGIALIGATGTVGRPLVESLLRRGCRPLLLMRDPARLPRAWSDAGAGARAFDLDEPALAPAALTGVRRLFVLVNPRAEGVHKEFALARALGQRRLERVVRISVLGADAQSTSPVRRWHGEAEDAWGDLDVPTLNLRANFFMQSLLKMAPAMARRGVLALPSRSGRVSVVDARDLAACAAQALCAPSPQAGACPVTGPRSWSFAAIAALVGAHIGRPVRHEPMERAAFVERLQRQPGMTPAQAELLAGIYDDIEQGLNAAPAGELPPVPGHGLRSLELFVQEHRGAFAAA